MHYVIQRVANEVQFFQRYFERPPFEVIFVHRVVRIMLGRTWLLGAWWIADYETLHVCRVPYCQQCQFFGGDPVTQLNLKKNVKQCFNLIMSHYKTALLMPVIPFLSERGFNSATFMCRHIVLSTIINFSNLHLKNQKSLFFIFVPSHWQIAICIPVIPFPSERLFNSATFMCGHIVLTTIRKFSNLHLKNCSG